MSTNTYIVRRIERRS